MLGEEAREGKGGRKGSWKEEYHIFTNSRKVTRPLSVLYLSETCLFWVGTMSHGFSWELSSKDTVCCRLASNVTTFMMSYLWLPDSVFKLHFLILQGEVGGGGLNLVWGSILRKTLLEHLPARTGSRQNDSPLSPLSLPQTCHSFGVPDWFNTHRVWETVQRPWVQTVETLFFF